MPVIPIPLAARSNVWVCGRSLAGIVGSNPARGMNVCCQSEVSTTNWSIFQQSSTDCGESSWSRDLKNEEAMARVGPQRYRKKKYFVTYTKVKVMQSRYRPGVAQHSTLTTVLPRSPHIRIYTLNISELKKCSVFISEKFDGSVCLLHVHHITSVIWCVT